MEHNQHKIRAVFLDSGDTLVDEGTEVKTPEGVALTAELIPGASRMVCALKELGYPLALVADGPVGTFYNVLGQHGLLKLFDVLAISGEVGAQKPDPRIFRYALDQSGIAPQEYSRVIMLGNNLERDIKGANALGLISVWLDWAPRRSKIPADASEEPLYTIKAPIDLLDLVAKLEENMP